MEKRITVYHGSEKIIEVPEFGAGKKNNDFGLGFYCTESVALAKEWAESFLNNGISVEQLARAMRLGKPREQIVIKSQSAFFKLKFEGIEAAEKDKYY